MITRILRALVFVTLFAWNAAAAEPAPRPNILLIMADDMGFSDIGCYGGEVHTPNIDRLAAEGVRFRQFYNMSRCCPTRACLLTGLYPHEAGVGHMVNPRNVPGYEGHLNDSCVTMAEALRPAGYQTWMVGKWHVGEKRPWWPVDRGFQHYYGLISGATNYYKLDKGRVFAIDGEKADPTGGPGFYLTDAFTDRAVKDIQQAAQSPEPFFLYLAYNAPHWPLHALPEDIAKYRGKYRIGWDALREQRRQRQIEIGLTDARWELTPRDPRVRAWDELSDAQKDAQDLKMAVYAAQIDRMDQGIGRVIEALRSTGKLDNTIIFFLADNGACAEIVNRGEKGALPGTRESFMSYGIGWANASNTPFRLYKHWEHEGGISTPLVVRWPGHAKPGTMVSDPGHLVDLMPTLLEVAGASYPKTRNGKSITPLEGRSLVSVLEGKGRAIAPIFWEHEGNRAVRLGKWKLVSRYPGKWELYDMEADRTEMHNLAQAQPQRVADMSRLYQEYARRGNVVPWAELTKKKAK